ncbi:hypothetical protein ES703_102146 [subsurface metagenome]
MLVAALHLGLLFERSASFQGASDGRADKKTSAGVAG